MTPQRITRSTRSGSLLASPVPDQPNKETASAEVSKSSRKVTRSNDSITHYKRSSIRTRSSIAGDGGIETASNDDEDDDDDDDDGDSSDKKLKPIVKAPSGDGLENPKDLQNDSVANFSKGKESSRAGLSNSNENDNIVQNQPDTAMLNAALSQENDLELSSENADGHSEAGNEAQTDNDSDDDYDGIERLSDVSESSAQFEAEVERDIRAADEDGIDWDDENIFDDDRRSTALLFRNGMFLNESLEISTLYTIGPTDEHPHLTEGIVWYGRVGDSWGMTSSSSSSSADDNGSSGSRPTSRRGSYDDRNGSTGMDISTAPDDGDTTDEEFLPISTVVSSSRNLLNRNGSNPDYSSKRITANTLPRVKGTQRPAMKSLTVGPGKAICYSVKGPGNQRHIRFIPPKNRTLKWVDIRSSRSSSTISSTPPSSPTVINMEAAIADGNTGSGAHITDVLYGRIFQHAHCSNRSEQENESAAATTEFGRNPYLSNVPRPRGTQEPRRNSFLEHIAHALHDPKSSDAALALIDFEAAGTDSSEGSDDVSAPYIDTKPTHSIGVELVSSPLFTHENNENRPPPDSVMVDVIPETPAGRDTVTHPKNHSISSNIRGLNLGDVNTPSDMNFQTPNTMTTPTTPIDDNEAFSPIFTSPVQSDTTPHKRRFDETYTSEEALASVRPSIRRKLS